MSRMTPDVAIGATYTIVGAVAGAFLALIPITLVGLLSRYSEDERTAKLLLGELQAIEKFARGLAADPDPAGKQYSHGPTGAWSFAQTSPSFILSLPNKLFELLSDTFEEMALLNGLLDRTVASMVQMQTNPSWGGQHQSLKIALNTSLTTTATNATRKASLAIGDARLRCHLSRLKRNVCVLRLAVLVLALMACVAVGTAAVSVYPGITSHH